MRTPSPPRSLADSFWIFCLLISVSALLAIGLLENGHGWGDDFASYIMQAQSLVSGRMTEFIAQNRFTIESSNLTLGPVAYPWGTPLLLSPLVRQWGANPLALKSLNVACFLAFLAVLWFGLRPYLSPGWGLLYFLLFAFNPFLFSMLNGILSDLPFLLFSTLALLLLRRAVMEERRLLQRSTDRLLLGLLIGIAVTLRTNGLLLLGALLLTQAVRNTEETRPAAESPYKGAHPLRQRLVAWLSAARPASWREALIQSLPVLAFILFSAAWMMVFPDSGLSQFGVFSRIKITTILYHLYYYFVIPAEFLTPLNRNWLLFAVFVFFTAWGLLRRARQDYDFFFYCLLTVLFYIFWPPLQGLRFLLPILPPLLLFSFGGLQAGIERLNPRWRRPAARASGAALVLLIGFFFVTLLNAARTNLQAGRQFNDGPYTAAAQELFAYLNDHTLPQEVVVFHKPRALRLFTGRPAFATTDPAMLGQADTLVLVANPGPHPVHQPDPTTIAECQRQGSLELVFENDSFQIYAIRKKP